VSAPLPFASIKNNFLRLDYLTTTGPRIIGLHVNGINGNLLAETPNIHWSTPHGEYYLRGGHRLWTAPEDPYYTCPEGGLFVIEERDKLILRSRVDHVGLEKEIAIQLDENCVKLEHRVTWHGEEPIELAPWAITQLHLGGLAILPLSNAEGLLPNRNLVLWPYTQIHDERLELHDDLILLHGSGNTQACKIGNRNSHGWVACILGNVLFIKRFKTDAPGTYPDMDCNVEAYVKDTCIELETLGPLKTLKQGEAVAHTETWQVIAGDYRATLETARKLSKQLS
jgi:hypothetical protein